MPKSPPTVFISYAREDLEDARKLFNDLKRAGVNPWLDKESLLPGQRWRVEIRRAIRESRYFLALLSSNSVSGRGYVHKEVAEALEILDEFPEPEIFIIPVRLDDCNPSHERLRDLHWVDMFPSWDYGFKKILLAVGVQRGGNGISWNWGGIMVAVIAVLITLGTWLVPNVVDFLSARLSKTPTLTPTGMVALTFSPTPTWFPTATLTSTSTPTWTPTSTPTPILAILTGVVRVFTAPESESHVGFLNMNDVVRVHAIYGDWVQIQAESIKGWVRRDYIRFSAEIPPTIITPINGDTPTPRPPTDTPTPIPPTPTPVPPTDTPTPSAPPDMVYVPAGEFIMGSTDAEIDSALALCYEHSRDCDTFRYPRLGNEQPQHTVYLDAFYIDKTEVINAQYRKCVEAGACSPPHHTDRRNDYDEYNDPKLTEHPVVDVDWNQANVYCQWSGKRLPTEAEWEKAARGTDGRVYPWGNTFDGSRVNFCDKSCPDMFSDASVDDGYTYTAPVGNYTAGASPYAALDMAGNVWEWVADWYAGNYSQYPERNPTGPDSGTYKTLRGGSWNEALAGVRCAVRLNRGPGHWKDDLGFRCARSAE